MSKITRSRKMLGTIVGVLLFTSVGVLLYYVLRFMFMPPCDSTNISTLLQCMQDHRQNMTYCMLAQLGALSSVVIGKFTLAILDHFNK